MLKSLRFEDFCAHWTGFWTLPANCWIKFWQGLLDVLHCQFKRSPWFHRLAFSIRCNSISIPHQVCLCFCLLTGVLWWHRCSCSNSCGDSGENAEQNSGISGSALFLRLPKYYCRVPSVFSATSPVALVAGASHELHLHLHPLRTLAGELTT